MAVTRKPRCRIETAAGSLTTARFLTQGRAVLAFAGIPRERISVEIGGKLAIGGFGVEGLAKSADLGQIGLGFRDARVGLDLGGKLLAGGGLGILQRIDGSGLGVAGSSRTSRCVGPAQLGVHRVLSCPSCSLSVGMRTAVPLQVVLTPFCRSRQC